MNRRKAKTGATWLFVFFASYVSLGQSSKTFQLIRFNSIGKVIHTLAQGKQTERRTISTPRVEFWSWMCNFMQPAV